ncbi:MAG: hypothetical protein IKY83_06100 [Proteobacteria bacterium]|nr:hypothetical protein [Pseudomonadota bacterium]
MPHPILKSAILIALFLNVHPAFADTRCPVERQDSVFCDDSWHGSLEFLSFLGRRHQALRYSDQLENTLPDADKSLQIWLTPPASLDAEAVQSMLDQGARILVFDESDITLSWFISLRHQPALSEQAPQTPHASHINGNPALPVFDQVSELLNVTRPLPQKLQVAFNHATPLLTIEHDIAVMLHTYAVPATLDSLAAGQGALFVIRDESLTTRLMLHTLDNAAFLDKILDTLCADRLPCPITLYEPNFSYTPSGEIPPDDNGFIQSMQKSTKTLHDRLTDRWEATRNKRENIPWAFVVLSCVIVWSLCAFLFGVPSGRVRE